MDLQHNILWPSPPTQPINYLTGLSPSSPHSNLARPALPSPIPTSSTQQWTPIKSTPSDNSLHLNLVAWQPWTIDLSLRKLVPHSYPLCLKMSIHKQIALNSTGICGHIQGQRLRNQSWALFLGTRQLRNWNCAQRFCHFKYENCRHKKLLSL